MKSKDSLPHSQKLACSEAFVCMIFKMFKFLRRGIVRTLVQPKAGGPPLVSSLQLLIHIFTATLHIWRPFLHPQPEHAPCRTDRDPLITDLKTRRWKYLILENAMRYEMYRNLQWRSLLPLGGKTSWESAWTGPARSNYCVTDLSRNKPLRNWIDGRNVSWWRLDSNGSMTSIILATISCCVSPVLIVFGP